MPRILIRTKIGEPIENAYILYNGTSASESTLNENLAYTFKTSLAQIKKSPRYAVINIEADMDWWKMATTYLKEQKTDSLQGMVYIHQDVAVLDLMYGDDLGISDRKLVSQARKLGSGSVKVYKSKPEFADDDAKFVFTYEFEEVARVARNKRLVLQINPDTSNLTDYVWTEYKKLFKLLTDYSKTSSGNRGTGVERLEVWDELPLWEDEQ